MDKQRLIQQLQQKIELLEKNLAKTLSTTQAYELLKNRIGATMQIMGGIIWMKNKEGVYQECNMAMAEALGFASPNDIIGKTDRELPWKEQAELLIANDKLVMDTGEVQRGKEEMVTTANGVMKTFIVAKAPLYDHHKHCIGTVGNSLDITYQKQLETELREAKRQAEAALTAKSDFIANISHDLRTPLLGLMGLAENISQREEARHYQTELMDIVESAKMLYGFLEQVIVLVSTEQRSTQTVSFSLAEIITELTALLQPSIKAKELVLFVHYDPTLPKQLMGDAMAVHRILLNLLGNAIKFTNKGQIDLTIHCDKIEETRCTVRLTVRDTGIGIPHEELSHIFERFNRLHPAYQGVYPGAGLGLSIVKQLVEQLHGEITVESEYGVSSSFCVVLPFELVSEATARAANYHSSIHLPYYDEVTLYPTTQTPLISTLTTENTTHTHYHYRILLVEDHAMLSKNMAQMLRGLGAHVDCALSGQEAIALVTQHRYDLIFMDLGLPDLDGLTVTQQIRALTNNPNQEIPIIAQTAHLGLDKRQAALNAGLNEVIVKPLSLEKAKAALAYFLRHQSDKLKQFQDIVPEPWVAEIAPDIKVIDYEDATKRLEISVVEAKDFIAKLIDCLFLDRKAINEAYHARDIKEIRAQCHRLYGALCFTSVPRLTLALKRFHQTVREQGFTREAQALHQQFNEEVDRLIATFREDNAK